MFEHGGPKRQRGSIILSSGSATGVLNNPRVFLSNRTITDNETDPDDARAGLVFQTTGLLQERRDNPLSTTDIAGQYINIQPVTDIGDDWEVRALAAGAMFGWSSAAALDDIWITMTAARLWEITQTVIGNRTVFRTFEVGPDGVESAEDSAAITCNANVTA